MSEVSEAPEKGADGQGGDRHGDGGDPSARGRRWTLLAVAIAAVGVFVVALFVFAQMQPGKTPGGGVALVAHDGPFGRFAKGSMAKLQTWSDARQAPAASFNDADGKPLDLSRFRGKVV